MIGRTVGSWAAFVCALAAGAMTVLTCGGVVFGEDALVTRFRQEAPAQWRKYRELASHSAGVVKEQHTFVRRLVAKVTESSVTTREFSFAVDGQFARWMMGGFGSDEPPLCEAVNPDYGFAVVAKKPGEWRVVPKDKSVYRLSSFGLPEPRLPVKPSEDTP